MKNLLFTLSLALISISTYGQLIEHYSFSQDEQTLNLIEKMAYENVPGLSIHIQYDDKCDQLLLGDRQADTNDPVTAETRFQVGSLSTAPALFEVLRLADAGQLDLDAAIQTYIPELADKRWFKNKKVTIRDIILDKAKLNSPMKPTGYGAGESFPSLAEILETGNEDFPGGIILRKSNNRGQQPQYANAVLVQLLLERIHQQPLADIIEKNVFEPLGMAHSYYATALSAEQMAQIAVGHDGEGNVLAGNYRRYVAQGAAGLWTTPSDFAKLVQHVMDAAQGKDNRFLSAATAMKGVTRQHGYRSLLFHIGDNGGIYWGGNAKGYFTAMQANLKDRYVMVAFCNGDLNWPLVMGTLYQSGGWIAKQRKGESLVLFTQEGDEALSAPLIQQLQSYAQANHINFIQKDAAAGVPASITATPALIFQSPHGRSLFGGKVTEWSAVQNFIRTARSRSVAPEAAAPGMILARQEGRQTVGFPLKWTAWQGKQPQGNWKNDFIVRLEQQLNAPYSEAATFLPTDRRFYLDVHPYGVGDSVYLSLAVFSQFDCIHPIYDNFGAPLQGLASEKQAILSAAAAQFQLVIQQRWAKLSAGDALFPIAASIPVMDYEALGLQLPELPTSTSTEMALANSFMEDMQWTIPSALGADQPLLQFNFPSPLERYAGEVPQLDGQLAYQGGEISGEFIANLKTLTMGMAELDAKVLQQYLKVRRYSEARFSFAPQAVPMGWDRDNSIPITGQLDFLGQEIPLTVAATIHPTTEDESVRVEVEFELNIAQPFGLPGPDGPTYAKEHLQFRMAFQMAS